jgi:hypothetical protein
MVGNQEAKRGVEIASADCGADDVVNAFTDC